MITIPGYEVTEKINESTKTAVYRGNIRQTQQPVIIKVLRSEYPTLEEIVHLRQEYNIPKDIEYEGIVKPYSLETYHNSYALILEDFGGKSLSQAFTIQKLTLEAQLQIAIALADTLMHLHKAGITHKDIKPSNIIINLETAQVKLTDFGLASRLSVENQSISNPNLLEGTLAYMSPEQTGRMNRSIDYRTDFYSLGVTLYEMFTGKLPFITHEPMEMVHCHIAKQPTPLVLNSSIPQALSDIVLRLLAKNAEDRYQSAAGLKFDLETCLRQLQTTGTIAHLVPGQRDRGNQLLIPQKLYGREREIDTLMAAFRRVCLGATEMMLVSGYSGIGKTSIVNEVHKPIVAARGYFIAGKFDQLKRNIPYAALIEAFQELVRQILAESQPQLEIWRTKLLSALGSNGQVVIDVIPEVELITGHQPEVAKLGSSESQNRFNQVFQQFVRVFCQPEHPLVIFLDDLQWADSASLNLIQLLITDDKSQYLFLIGAYRDNEVDPTHPLVRSLEKIQEADTVVHTITVGPLLLHHVTQLIVETLQGTVDAEALQALVELVFNKTQGNPFFISQLLKALYAEHLLTYEVNSDRWQWDIEQIQAVGITDYNVVELIARNINKLPPETQKALKLAACIGNHFNLDILAIVNQASDSSTASQLWPALQAGLILPSSTTYKIPLAFQESESVAFQIQDVKVDYKFLHDRVQQAAYSLIPESEKKATHLSIGQLLLKRTTPEEQRDNVFALVNQLNFGTDLLTHQQQKDELANLNLLAGQKAKASTAYEAAVNYLSVGLALLKSNSWQTQYEFTLTFYLEIAEAEYLNANLEQATSRCDQALKQVKTTLDEAKFYELKIKIYLAQSQIKTVIETGLKVLDMLGVSLVEARPEDLDMEAIANLPRMTDDYKLLAMGIINLIYGPACFGESSLALPLLYTMIELSRQYGNSPPAIYAYALHGVITSWLVPDIDLAYQLGQLALTILDKLDAREVQSKALLTININIDFKKKHIRETLEPLDKAIKSGLEAGDVEFACHSAQFYCDHLFFVGEHLETVAQTQSNYIRFISKFGQQHPLYLNKICAQAVANLVDPSPVEESTNLYKLAGNFFNEEETLPQFLEVNNLISIFSVYFYKCLLCYLFEDYASAVENAKLAMKYAGFVLSEIIFTKQNLYYSLSLLAQYPQASTQAEMGEPSEQQQYMEQVNENQKLMDYWMQHAPMNFQHQYELVEAEKARVLGHTLEAMEYYDRAIAGARAQGYVPEEALAYELAAKFYRDLGREEIAQSYMTKAKYSYIRWGAIAKVKSLESRYPNLIEVVSASGQGEGPKIRTTLSTTSGKASVLDLETILKASQVLGGEIILDRLLEKLIAIVIENAGAERGVLVLKHKEQLLIEAEGVAEPAHINVLQSIPLQSSQFLAHSVINYVFHTQKSIVLDDARSDDRFASDPYIQAHQAKSILCTPLIYQGELIGIIYLENNLTTEAFNADRPQVVNLLCSQAAIYIKNAQLYAIQEKYAQELEQKVLERTVKLTEANQQLQRLATSDSLTQVANRRYFDQYLSQEWRRSLREMQPISLILCDVDYFKRYNDHYGHQKGDDCLYKVAQIMKQTVNRPTDLVARYGGEEFTVILPSTDAEGVRTIAQRIQESVRHLKLPHAQSEVSPYITISMGVGTIVAQENLTPENLIAAVDIALYKAKKQGRDRIVLAGFEEILSPKEA